DWRCRLHYSRLWVVTTGGVEICGFQSRTAVHRYRAGLGWMAISDEALIARFVATKDQHAFSQLVLRYQSQLRTWARRLCNGDVHLADDLAQEAFIKAYAALPAFRAEAKFSTWLYRIAFNIAASRWRAKKIEWCELDENHDEVSDTCEAQPFAARKDVEAALQHLSPAQPHASR